MKRNFYFIFAIIVIIASFVIANKYWQNYSFEKNIDKVNALGLKMDVQAQELSQAIGESLAYQMLYAKYFFEEGSDTSDLINAGAESLAQGVITKEDIKKYAQDALKTPQIYKSPQEDPAKAEFIVQKNPQAKSDALAATVKEQAMLSKNILRYLKDQELPLDALYWANEIKEKRATLEQLKTASANWLGDDSQNARLIKEIEKYVTKGTARPLTQKEQDLQFSYSQKIAQLFNPVLTAKEDIAALTPQVCLPLQVTFWSNAVKAKETTLDELKEVIKDWAKDEQYKQDFLKGIEEETKIPDIKPLRYRESLQLNTCNTL